MALCQFTIASGEGDCNVFTWFIFLASTKVELDSSIKEMGLKGDWVSCKAPSEFMPAMVMNMQPAFSSSVICFSKSSTRASRATRRSSYKSSLSFLFKSRKVNPPVYRIGASTPISLLFFAAILAERK